MKVYILSQFCNFESCGHSEQTILAVYKNLEDAWADKEACYAEHDDDCYSFSVDIREVIFETTDD